MKLISYNKSGSPGYGALISDDGVVDLSARLGARYPDLKSAMAPEGIADLAAAVEGQAADFALGDVTLDAVIPRPDKIICVGLNYESHRKETGRDKSANPTLFARFANSQMGHGAPIIRPHVSDKLDYEGEIAVIIGKAGRYIKEADAMDHVAGYSCYNDATLRDWQRHTSQFLPGKTFVATGGFGPWMITADEAPETFELTTRLNGEVMQNATSDMMIFSIPEIIAYCSSFTELVPGDVIATGTPGGVGFKRDPAVFMKPGDSVEVEISGIGTLVNPIEDEQDLT